LQYWGRSNTHQQRFAIGLRFGQKFFNVAFCSYLHLQYFNWAAVPGGRFSNPPTSQSPIVSCHTHSLQMTHNLFETMFFNYEKFDFWIIYERIIKFYPIGILRDNYKFYETFPGRKEFVELLEENIHNNRNFQKRWVSFDKEIKKQTQKKIIGTTYGQIPCFSSYIELEKKTKNGFKHFKEIHYFVSLLGNFYTIIGEDRNELTEGKNKFRTTNYLIASPENEYAEIFTLLSEQIELRFENYKFVPFNICAQKLIGLDVRDGLEKQDTIFSAIFNNQISFNNRILGNQFYKSEDWIKEGYVDDGNHWTIYPPE
jgi:hypothetical protein